MPILARDRWSISELLRCAAQAATVMPPSRFCQSAPRSVDAPFQDLPTVPCRFWVTRWGYRLREVDWTDAAHRLDQLHALLVERAIHLCPFLDLAPFTEELARGRRPIADDSGAPGAASANGHRTNATPRRDGPDGGAE